MGAAIAIAALLVLGATTARGQGEPLAHAPAYQQPRALHERLMAADVVAAGSVREIGLGRIQIEDASVLLGRAEARFAIKRAPSRPPELAQGDRVLLLLRGARDPYVLVDTPFEIVSLEAPDAEPGWRGALAELRGALERPAAAQGAALRDLYLAWLERSEPSLRRVGLEALTGPTTGLAPLKEAQGRALVSTALDVSLPAERRRAAARVALRDSGAGSALLERLPGPQESFDRELLQSALRSAALRDDLDAGPLLARCLRHPREEVRAEALKLSALAARSAAARAELERIAAEDPNPVLRRQARRGLALEAERD